MWAGHGAIDLRRALAVSCNPYFEWVGEQLGLRRRSSATRTCSGLGEPSGINLTGESAGRRAVFVRPSAVGHLSSHAEGIATSAVQLAVLISATVNGGVVLRPQVSGPEDFAATRALAAPGDARASTGLSRGFVGAVNEGSASAAFDPEVAVAGKTGTCSAARLVRVLRAGRRPGARGGGVPEARQRPRRLRRGRPHLPSAVRRRLGQRPPPACPRRPGAPAHREVGRLARGDVHLALDGAVAGPNHLDPVPPGREPQRGRLASRARGRPRPRRPTRPPAGRSGGGARETATSLRAGRSSLSDQRSSASRSRGDRSRARPA